MSNLTTPVELETVTTIVHYLNMYLIRCYGKDFGLNDIGWINHGSVSGRPLSERDGFGHILQSSFTDERVFE